MDLAILKQYIRSVIAERLEGAHLWNKAQGSYTDREQIGSITAKASDEEISDHLTEPEVDVEDCFGPVPPVAPDPNVSSDPFTKDYHVIPTRPIYRGK